MSDTTAKPLTPCPLCGSDVGYKLRDGDTFSWWNVDCAGCGSTVSECRSDSSTKLGAPKPERWIAADDAWNDAGAYSFGLRAEVERLRAALASLHDLGSVSPGKDTP